MAVRRRRAPLHKTTAQKASKPHVESGIPPERISRTKVSDRPRPREDESTRAPNAWADRLLAAVIDLPCRDGEDAVVETMVAALSSILPECAVGVCFVPRDGGQRIFARTPATDAPRAPGADPTRLFPGYTHERVAAVTGEAAGSTLHIASEDPSLKDDGSPFAHLARRAAHALGRAVEHARAHRALAETAREVKLLEAHAIQADKLASFGQIAAGLVHELNNPLTSIVAYSDYLIKRATLHGERGDDTERLRRIAESANRMLRFTRDLVSYARPSGEVPVPVVLHGVIDQALAFCEHELAEVGAEVERRYGSDVLTVRGMPEQLAQVFVNLVTNACHAVPRFQGRVSIATMLVDAARSVEIEVTDNGHGIAAEHVAHVFAPFFTTKGNGRGTGLGLSIVKNIVENHGGSIEVGRGAGGGTRFIVTLPVGGPG